MKLYSLEKIIQLNQGIKDKEFKDLIWVIYHAYALTKQIETDEFLKGSYETDCILTNLRHFINKLDI